MDSSCQKGKTSLTYQQQCLLARCGLRATVVNHFIVFYLAKWGKSRYFMERLTKNPFSENRLFGVLLFLGKKREAQEVETQRGIWQRSLEHESDPRTSNQNRDRCLRQFKHRPILRMNICFNTHLLQHHAMPTLQSKVARSTVCLLRAILSLQRPGSTAEC